MSENIGIKEKINAQIDVDKEILSVLPKNNKKNLQAYKDKAAEIGSEYSNYLSEIINEMKRRVVKIKSFTPDPKSEEITKEIQELSNKIVILNPNTTSFEKMQLDEILYILKNFYKNNLELVNNAIVQAIDKFRMVGVYLTADDFNYSAFAKEYMQVFLEEMKKGDPNSPRVKETFEQIYWKCSDIIIHIELNIRSIYFRYEKSINKYFESENKSILKNTGLKPEEIIGKYNNLQTQLIDINNKDTGLIIEKFLNNEIVPKDFEESSIKKNYKKIIGKDLEEFDNEKVQEINKNIIRLNESLYEFKNYLKYKYIFDDVLEIYNSKEKYKPICEQKLKQIKKLEAKLFKINKRLNRVENHKGLFKKIFSKNNNRLEKINININTQILELKQIYMDYEENKVKNIIATTFNDSSTIYDVLLLISNFYVFLVKSIIKEYPEIKPEEIQDVIEQFRIFIKYPKVTIINNVKISEDKDITLMIKDKYNLCDIILTKQDLDEDNLPNLITVVNNICQSNYIKNSKTTLEDIQFLLQVNKILDDNNINN